MLAASKNSHDLGWARSGNLKIDDDIAYPLNAMKDHARDEIEPQVGEGDSEHEDDDDDLDERHRRHHSVAAVVCDVSQRREIAGVDELIRVLQQAAQRRNNAVPTTKQSAPKRKWGKGQGTNRVSRKAPRRKRLLHVYSSAEDPNSVRLSLLDGIRRSLAIKSTSRTDNAEVGQASIRMTNSKIVDLKDETQEMETST